MSTARPLVLVAGAGAGLGQALLARFETAGFTPVGLGRSQPNQTVGEFHTLDLADEAAVQATVADVMAHHGPPKVVIHNAAELKIAPFEDTQPGDFQRTWSSMVLSAVVLARATITPMVDAGGGSYIVSGATASIRGGARFAAFASAKFALRGLTQSLAREYQPAGVHVCHVILDGIIDSEKSRVLHGLGPSKMMQTKAIAEAYLQIA
ncbi:MAG: SDR family NAD(P)-dependent oxidoreductase, partial [Pseudomonadota bacterium]